MIVLVIFLLIIIAVLLWFIIRGLLDIYKLFNQRFQEMSIYDLKTLKNISDLDKIMPYLLEKMKEEKKSNNNKEINEEEKNRFWQIKGKEEN